MSTPEPTTPPVQPARAPAKPSMAGRYLFLFLFGLVMGVVAVVMLLRTLDERKTWRDHYPTATMQLLSAHTSQLRESMDANRCSPTDVLPHLQSLRSLGNDLEPAFVDLASNTHYVGHAANFRATLDAALASPPLNCEGAQAVAKDIGEACKACHQQFR